MDRKHANKLGTRTWMQSGIALAAALLLGACASSGVNEGDINVIGLDEEWELGRQLEADLAKELDLVNDREILAYINRAGQQVVAQTEMASLPWEFHVVRDDAINAFNIPGGHVYINTGLITAAQSASELMGVVSHEIAHGVSRHATERLTRVHGLNFLASVLLGSDPQTYQTILAQILGTGAIASFSRDAEEEADELGVRYMYAAGYDPLGMPRMFEHLLAERQRRPDGVSRFFSTHPLTEDRIRATRAQAEALPPKPGLIEDETEFQRVKDRVR
ncbi:MAG: M48 family metalloprotease [Xanthomonadales bacterium]|nr:M48 family metalloprotease [Xanthomonadales bacterium]